MVRIINRAVPHENLACIFGICADGTSVSPADVQPVPLTLFNHLWMHAVRTEFSRLAQTSERDALAWHVKHARCFCALPGAPVEAVLDEVSQFHARVESRVFSELLWLKADAVSFLPEPGKPDAGWSDAFAFMWAFQQLSPDIRDQINPCQLLIARLPAASPAK